MLKTAPTPIYLSDYRPSDFLIDTVDLTFTIEENRTQVCSTLSISRNGEHARALRLDGHDITLCSLVLDGRTLTESDYQLDAQSLQIAVAAQQFTLQILTEITPKTNTALEGLYYADGCYSTQCEPQGFRRITYYLDRPDVMARFSVRIEADQDSCPVLLSNGNRTDSGPLDNNRHFVCWQDPFPKPCYLFALVAGDLACIEDTYVTRSNRTIALAFYLDARHASQCAHAMESLKRAMRWDEQVYGLEYDLDTYMVYVTQSFNMGAMENKGLNIFNANYVLADRASATDRDFENIESVIAHEYFHNWTGNRVTCRDWFQLSLKEGLTVFRDQEFSADMNSRASCRIDDADVVRVHQFREDASPVAHPVRPESYIEINNFYTLTVYEKGAELIRMLQTLLGREKFIAGVQHYLTQHDGTAATCDDFCHAMQTVSGIDLTQFKRWYAETGTPQLQIQMHYDAQKKTCQLQLRQFSPEPAPLHIPVRVSLFDSDGQPIALRGPVGGGESEALIECKENLTEVVFEQVDQPPTPSLLRGFSAPVNYTFDYSDDQLMMLMMHDDDPFNRWDAGQQLTTRLFLQLMSDPQNSVIPEHWIAAHRSLFSHIEDRQLLAQMLQLPSLDTLSQACENIDMPTVFTVRQRMVCGLAQALEPELHQTYQNNQHDKSELADAHNIGIRRLKNTCLALLAANDQAPVRELVIAQYDAARCMNDELAALQILCDSEAHDIAPQLAHFEQKWQANRLVIDKWFRLQALSKRSDTLARVESLSRHPAFDRTNPNRVRALLGAYSLGNPARFHRPDGKGYDLLCQWIIELDAINPQTSAGLVDCMSHWRAHIDPMRAAMHRALVRLSDANLSQQVRELLGKILGQSSEQTDETHRS